MVPKIPKAKLNKIVENYEQTWDSLFYNRDFELRKEPDPHMNDVVEILKENNIKLVASAPCGDYINENLLEEEGFQVDGYEISNIAIEKIMKTKISDSPIVKIDLLKQKLPKQYGAIMSLDFAVHLPDENLLVFFENMYKSLRKGGILCMNFLNPEDETKLMDETDRQNIALVKNDEIILKYRTKKQIEDLVAKSKFKIKKVKKYERTDKGHRGFRSKAVPHKHKGYCVMLVKE